MFAVLVLLNAAHAADDTPPPPATSGIGSSPTSAGSGVEVVPVATVTDIPPWLRGDLALNYSFERVGGKLREHVLESPGDEELDQDVGQRTLSAHTLNIDAMFSAGPGIGVTLGFPVRVREGTWFGTSQTMVYDPSTDSGTMIGTGSEELNDVSVGSGLDGVWIGIAGTPFSERFERRKNRVTWKLGGAVRTPNKRTFYTAEDGKRGAGSGGLGFRLESAFSSTVGDTQPYLSVRYQTNGKTTQDPTDEDGNTIGSGVEFVGGKEADFRFGAEFMVAHNSERDTDVRIDVAGAINYDSWKSVPSGLYLPSILDVSYGQAVQTAEALDMGGALGLSVQAVKYLRFGVGAVVQYHMPQRIENPYPIYTGNDTIRTLVTANMTARIR